MLFQRRRNLFSRFDTAAQRFILMHYVYPASRIPYPASRIPSQVREDNPEFFPRLDLSQWNFITLTVNSSNGCSPVI